MDRLPASFSASWSYGSTMAEIYPYIPICSVFTDSLVITFHTISPVKLYSIMGSIGGDVYGDGSAERDSILTGLGWLRAIAVVYWYAGANEAVPSALPVMSTAVKNFKLVEEGGLADSPISRFSADSDTDALYRYYFDFNYSFIAIYDNQTPSFSLLDLLFSGNESDVSVEMRVIRCLLAQGFGRDLLDGRSPYLIFTVLECLNVVSNSSFAACVVRQDMIFQLLSEGQWAWAVFVALQIEDADVRYDCDSQF